METNRRNFLKAAGVTLALPAFESLGATEKQLSPKRMVCINNYLSMLRHNFHPEKPGFDYKPSRYLKFLQEFRSQFTTFSGVSHPEVAGAHNSQKSFLTCAPHPELGSFKNSISLDQLVAEKVGHHTRFDSLTLTANGSATLSWTRAGVPIPSIQSAAGLYTKLFVNGTKEEVEKQVLRLKMGQSVMDSVLDKAKRFASNLNPSDKSKYDEYLTSVRGLEKQMVRMQEWEKSPKPKVNYKKPKDIKGKADIIGKTRLMYDLIYLAFKTDQTRVVSLNLMGHFVVPPIDGVKEGYHTLSHHGMNPEKLKQLALIEDEHMKALRDLMSNLNSIKEPNGTLLDNTMVFYGSNLGNASGHDTTNVPALLAGGGFKHGQYLAFDEKRNEPLANIYVAMAQKMGLEIDRFGSSTRTAPLNFS